LRIIAASALLVTAFTTCGQTAEKSSAKIEDKIRKGLSITRFLQKVISPPLANKLLKKQVERLKFRDGTTRESVIANGVPCEWITPAETVADGVLLYIHGGGFVIGNTPGHLRLVANLAGKMKIRALMVDYRLAPQYPFPAALEDCVSVYNWLLSRDIPPQNIFIAGDSAGGNLTLTTLLKLREQNIPLPAAAACLSPAVNLVPNANYIEGYKDPILPSKSAEFYRTSYTGNEDPKNPFISPCFADLGGLPPILIHIGEDESLRVSADALFHSASEAGIDITYKVFPGMWHVWQLYAKLPQTDQSLGEVGEFLSARGME
jgi:acetyl esterase/lipase